MQKFSLLFILLSFLSVNASADIVLDEIRKNLTETRKRMELAKDRMEELEANNEKIDTNVSVLNRTMNKKSAVRQDILQMMKNYNRRVDQADAARKEFLAALKKDTKELSMVRKETLLTKKKLGALKAAEDALEDSIEISEESLDKISSRMQKWRGNYSVAKSDLDDVVSEVEVIKKKFDKQVKVQKDYNSALAKWRKSYNNLKKLVDDLELKYRKQQRASKK